MAAGTSWASSAEAAAVAPPARANASAIVRAPSRRAIASRTAARSASGVSAVGRQGGAGAEGRDACADLELVASERDDAQWHARGERLLRDAHAAVADDARRARQQRAVRQPPLQAGVGRGRERLGVVGGGADGDAHGLVGECEQRCLDQGVVALELAGGAHDDERLRQLVEPGRGGRWWLPEAGADEAERRREAEVGALERRRGVVEVQRRAPDLVRARQRR